MEPYTTTPFMSGSMRAGAYGAGIVGFRHVRGGTAVYGGRLAGGGFSPYDAYRMKSTSYRLFSSNTGTQYTSFAAATSEPYLPSASQGNAPFWQIDSEVASGILGLFNTGNTTYYEENWDGDGRPDRPPVGQYTPIGDAVLPMLALALCFVVRTFIKSRKRLISK